MKIRIIEYFKSHSPDTQGILWMIAACFWFASMASLIRHLSLSMDPLVIVFFRNLFSLICIIPAAHKYGFSKIRTKHWKLYGIRVISGVIGMTLIFVAISEIPLTEVTSFTFTVPLITTLFAIIFLKERPKMHNWVALALGFIGILVILRPGTQALQLASFMAIGAACCWSVSNILIKKLTSTDSPKNIVFIMIIIITPFSLPGALIKWQTPDITQLLWLILLGWVSNQAQFSMTNAYSKTDISTVLPFDFSRLIFISIFAYIFFGEVVDIYTIIGAIIIFTSGFYIVTKQRKKTPPVIDPSDSLV